MPIKHINLYGEIAGLFAVGVQIVGLKNKLFLIILNVAVFFVTLQKFGGRGKDSRGNSHSISSPDTGTLLWEAKVSIASLSGENGHYFLKH